MVWSSLVAILLGILTGLTPGIHNNTVTAILITLIPSLALQPLVLVVFVVVIALTHTIIDFIPSIFTGATDGESFMATLPGHDMLNEGRGIEAVMATTFGAKISILLIIVIAPFFVIFVPKIIDLIKLFIPFILLIISLYAIFREKYIYTALSVWGLSGFLGYASFNLPIQEPLLPLLSGLFGGSGLILSILQKMKIPQQKYIKHLKFERKEIIKATIGAAISSPLCSFLPAIGSGHAAAIGSEITNQDKRGFLIMLGAINTTVMTLSFATLYSIGKTRTGAAAAIQEIIPKLTTQMIVIIITVAIITIFFVSIFAVHLARFFALKLNKIKYNLLSIVMLVIILIVLIIFTNYLGLVVFITGSALGIFAIRSGIRQINLMGCLMLPTILFYFIS